MVMSLPASPLLALAAYHCWPASPSQVHMMTAALSLSPDAARHSLLELLAFQRCAAAVLAEAQVALATEKTATERKAPARRDMRFVLTC